MLVMPILINNDSFESSWSMVECRSLIWIWQRKYHIHIFSIGECPSFQLHFLVFITIWNHSQYQDQHYCIYAKLVVPHRADRFTSFVCIAYMLSCISTISNSNQSWKQKHSLMLTWIMTYMTQPGSICSTLEQTHLTIFGVKVTSNHFNWLQDLWKLYTLSGTR